MVYSRHANKVFQIPTVFYSIVSLSNTIAQRNERRMISIESWKMGSLEQTVLSILMSRHHVPLIHSITV